MRETTKALAMAVLMVVVLVGCSAPTGLDMPNDVDLTCVESGRMDYGEVQTCTIELPDTRLVTCLIFDGYNSGGLDCDWNHASGADMEPGR